MGFKDGVVSTGNSLDAPPVDMETLKANDASVKEMEAAGIAHVAAMFGVPLIAVKAITDIVDGDKPTQDEFMENLGAAAKALQGAVPKVIEFIAGKEVSAL
jgi:5'-methylthioadenosine nucleosidase